MPELFSPKTNKRGWMSSICSTVTATVAVGYTISTVALGSIKHGRHAHSLVNLVRVRPGSGKLCPTRRFRLLVCRNIIGHMYDKTIIGVRDTLVPGR